MSVTATPYRYGNRDTEGRCSEALDALFQGLEL